MPIPILPQKANFHICCNSCCSFFYWSWKQSRQDMISTLKWKEALCEYIKVLPEMRRQTFLVSEETASFTLTQLKS